jgi:hypothetical protein
VLGAVAFVLAAELADGRSIQKKEAAIVTQVKTMRHFMAPRLDRNKTPPCKKDVRIYREIRCYRLRQAQV